jgi:hypothetical protein
LSYLNKDQSMSDLQDAMSLRLQSFVAQITEIARRAAVDTLESMFGDRPRRTNGLQAAVAATVPTAQPVRRRGGRVKRTAADLEALSEKFAAFIKVNPGLRVEQINKELGTTTKDLALPIRKLIADRMISAKGQKRSTMYFPGKKAKS